MVSYEALCIPFVWQSFQEDFGEHPQTASRIWWMLVALAGCMAMKVWVQADSAGRRVLVGSWGG